jgi:hypothetical protein
VRSLGAFLAELLLEQPHAWHAALAHGQAHDHDTEEAVVEWGLLRGGIQGVALTEEAWNARLEAEARAHEDAELRAAGEARKAALDAEDEKRRAEEERARAKLEELKASKPSTLEEAVDLQVKMRVQEERLRLLDELAEEHRALRNKVEMAEKILLPALEDEAQDPVVEAPKGNKTRPPSGGKTRPPSSRKTK